MARGSQLGLAFALLVLALPATLPSAAANPSIPGEDFVEKLIEEAVGDMQFCHAFVTEVGTVYVGNSGPCMMPKGAIWVGVGPLGLGIDPEVPPFVEGQLEGDCGSVPGHPPAPTVLCNMLYLVSPSS